MKNIAIVCSAKLPQPPVLGGAVPTLIQQLIDQNEIEKKIIITCISVFNEKAEQLSDKFSYTHFKYIKMTKVALLLDTIISKLMIMIKKTNKIYSWGYIFRVLAFRKGVSDILKNKSFDYIIFENSIPVFLSMKSKHLQSKYEGRYFYHTHCVPRNLFNSGLLLSKSKAIICVSQYIENETKKRFITFSNRMQCHILYNTVDTEIFRPLSNEMVQEWRTSYGINPNDFIIGFIGRISRDKGIVELIKAMKLIPDVDVKLVIAGSTFYDSNTKDKFVNDLKQLAISLKDRIIFTGYISNERTPLFYNSCDVICLPPIWEEPGAVTNIEAAACGRAIITTNSGGNNEYIGGKSIIIDKSNLNLLPSIISQKILSLKSNPQERVELEKKAFSWGKEQNKKKYFEHFINLLNESK